MCQVVLDSGHVVVSAGNKGVKSQKTYNDDNSHYVAFYRNTNGYATVRYIITLCLCTGLRLFLSLFRLRIYIDDVLESGGEAVIADTGRAALQSNITYVGGTPESHGLTNLIGCLSNFFIKRCV